MFTSTFLRARERLLESPIGPGLRKLLYRVQSDTQRATTAQRANKAQSEELSSYPIPEDLPEGSIHFQDFLSRHNLKQHRRRIAGYLDAPRNGLRYEAFPGRTERESERYLTPAQQEALLEWLEKRHGELFKSS